MEGSGMVVTPLYAGLLALWYLVLSVRVLQARGLVRVCGLAQNALACGAGLRVR